MKNTENPKRRKTFATRGGRGAERAVTRERPSGRVTIVRSERYSDQRRVAWPSPGVASRSEPPPSGAKQRAGSAIFRCATHRRLFLRPAWLNQVRTRQEPAIPCQSFLKCALAMTLL